MHPVNELLEELQGRAVRRFIRDIRSSHNRRHSLDRRSGEVTAEVAEVAVVAERRSVYERRTSPERRRPPQAIYSLEAASLIRRMMSDPRAGVWCPECEGNLMLGPAMVRQGVAMRRVHCTQCRRRTVTQQAS